ncbi:MAG: response regulator [Polyangiaceae bacterium]|nr:response regulator [Polyangiaceae bacterium]
MSHYETLNFPGRVLVVEDDPMIIALFQRWFSWHHELELVGASGAQEALRLWRESDFDLLLTDIELDGMNGVELAIEARRERPDAAIALMTAHASVDYATQAVRATVNDFIEKPLDKVDICGRVLALVAEVQKRRAGAGRTVLAAGAHPDDVEPRWNENSCAITHVSCCSK